MALCAVGQTELSAQLAHLFVAERSRLSNWDRIVKAQIFHQDRMHLDATLSKAALTALPCSDTSELRRLLSVLTIRLKPLLTWACVNKLDGVRKHYKQKLTLRLT